MNSEPRVTEILALLRARRGETMPTYYIKNVLREKHPGLKTPDVRRCLNALAKAGYVKRSEKTSSGSICWEAA